jgi:hypothetical protein
MLLAKVEQQYIIDRLGSLPTSRRTISYINLSFNIDLFTSRINFLPKKIFLDEFLQQKNIYDGHFMKKNSGKNVIVIFNLI